MKAKKMTNLVKQPALLVGLLLLTPVSANAAGTQATLPPDALERLHAADANHDGRISRSELLKARTDQWSRFDRNKDGYFSQDDLPSFIRSRWDSGDRLVQLRAQYDVNRDNRISRTEFVNGPTPVFDAADTNHDNAVDEAEIRAFEKTMRK